MEDYLIKMNPVIVRPVLKFHRKERALFVVIHVHTLKERTGTRKSKSACQASKCLDLFVSRDEKVAGRYHWEGPLKI